MMEAHFPTRVRWQVMASLLAAGVCLGFFVVFCFNLEVTRSIRTIPQSLGICPAAEFPGSSPGDLVDPRPFTAAAALVPLPPTDAPRAPEIKVLVGIPTRPQDWDTRHFLRLVYNPRQQPSVADVDVKFVMCNLTTEEERVLVSLEILRFDDIIILDCAENMDSGKTYIYFSSLPRILPRPYDYVMKADADTYVVLENLARALRRLPRKDVYYGFVTPPCRNINASKGYMSGMGYVLSWDLVEWISVSDIPAADVVGPEDLLVGRWLDKGKKAKNRRTEKPGMYDYEKADQGCRHKLIPHSVAIHRLKTREFWLDVLKFFEVTKPLKPSKLYHVD